jgi:hypothetical protein
MKPGSIVRRGYTKDSIRLARRFLHFRTFAQGSASGE